MTKTERIRKLENNIAKREIERRYITERALTRFQFLKNHEIIRITKLESDNIRDQAEVRHLWELLANK